MAQQLPPRVIVGVIVGYNYPPARFLCFCCNSGNRCAAVSATHVPGRGGSLALHKCRPLRLAPATRLLFLLLPALSSVPRVVLFASLLPPAFSFCPFLRCPLCFRWSALAIVLPPSPPPRLILRLHPLLVLIAIIPDTPSTHLFVFQGSRHAQRTEKHSTRMPVQTNS